MDDKIKTFISSHIRKLFLRRFFHVSIVVSLSFMNCQLSRLLRVKIACCIVYDERTFNQSRSETLVLCLTEVQSSKMENFFIPSSQINEVKQKIATVKEENFSLRCSLKLSFSVPLLRKDAQNQPKE